MYQVPTKNKAKSLATRSLYFTEVNQSIHPEVISIIRTMVTIKTG
jgi:hypothetical protein